MGTQDKDGEDRWLGYSCPGCHSLFRVAHESVGRQVACPACGEIALIAEEDVAGGGAPPDLPEAAGEPAESPEKAAKAAGGAAAVEEGEREPNEPPLRRRVKARLIENLPDEPAWEQEEFAAAPSREGGLRHVLAWVAGIAFLVLLGAAALVVFAGKAGTGAATPRDPEPAQAAPEWAGEAEHARAEVDEIELDAAFAKIEACVRRFLEAGSVEEMAGTVRGGEATKARMEEYYQRHDFAPTPYRAVAPAGNLQMSGAYWSVDVDLRGGPLKAIAVEETEAGFRVDWESWVGYSEMPWDEFLAGKPTEAVLFRVLCERVEYYNYEFADDSEWQSFRLVSPDRQHTVYGYVPRFSLAGRLLFDPAGRGGLKAFRLKLRFPERSSSDRQVVIDEVVGSGWVEGEESGNDDSM